MAPDLGAKRYTGSVPLRNQVLNVLWLSQIRGPWSVESEEDFMKTALILFFSCAGLMLAADEQKVKNPPSIPNGGEAKKLGSITWDMDSHKLVWVVNTGTMTDGKFVATGQRRYEISPDQATMIVAEEQRAFDNDEAVSLHRLLDVLSLYCAESVVWWEQGYGDPVDPQAKPPAEQNEHRKSTPSPQAEKPVRVKEQPKEEKKPAYRVPPSNVIAELR